jgi:hypothetical protein
MIRFRRRVVANVVGDFDNVPPTPCHFADEAARRSRAKDLETR